MIPETIRINGVARSFIALLPTARPAPLVIVLHGNTQSGADMRARTSWPRIAQHEQFGVVFPDGLNHAWADLRPSTKRAGRRPPAGTDDVGFIVALIDKFVGDGTADPQRIYITGLSNGGAMTMTMLGARADLFAAAASVIFNLTGEMAKACRPSRPVPFLMINGTADPLIPWQGGRGTSRFAVPGFWSGEQTFAFWQHVNGCDRADIATTEIEHRDAADPTSVTRIETRGATGRDVVLYRINGGGHRLPGAKSDMRFPRFATWLLGPQNHDIDGAEIIWAFFRRFVHP